MHCLFKIQGQYVEWDQLVELQSKLSGMSVVSQGLSLLPKLKREHHELTSFSRMRVDLAAMVTHTQYISREIYKSQVLSIIMYACYIIVGSQ